MESPGRLPCILLAAGASSRMGAQKLLMPVGGEPAARRAILSILPSCHPVIVVTGSRAPEVEAALAGLEGLVIVRNPRWGEGMVGSAIAGIDALPGGCPGFFLHHADMPFVEARVFALLAELVRSQGAAAARGGGGSAAAAFAETPAALQPEVALVAARDGRAGHPVYIPASYIPAIRAIGSGERLRPVLDSLGFRLVETGCDGVVEDMDSPGDYAALIAKYGLGGSRT
ncbi:nucleotidyltransferase family protein [bacterium]|nr:nucleotidyltransferase family protein [bacterium]